MDNSGGRIERNSAVMRHRFHSICPYFAMFPESFAEKWISRLSKPGDHILDPFSGRGTTAFQALLMDRFAVASDVNDVAICLTRAKTQAPSVDFVERRILELEKSFDGRTWRHSAASSPVFFHRAFSESTLQRLLYLRARLNWRTSRVDAMVAALAIGSLHGEMDKSSSYFSNQMPRTISTKPAYSIRYWEERGLEPPQRDVFSILKSRARFRYQSLPPKNRAIVFHADMRQLPKKADQLNGDIRACITSPPYLDVTNFEEDQWLRLWMLGGPPYPTRGRISQDDRHNVEERYWQFMRDMWHSLGSVMPRGADIVIRIGARKLSPEQLVHRLTETCVASPKRIVFATAEVSELKNRQTDHFRPGSKGCLVEVDCHFKVRA